MSRAIAIPSPIVCWPWHLHFLADGPGHPRGLNCRNCKRDIAVPQETPPFTPAVCLYCAFDLGLVAEEDTPL